MTRLWGDQRDNDDDDHDDDGDDDDDDCTTSRLRGLFLGSYRVHLGGILASEMSPKAFQGAFRGRVEGPWGVIWAI